MSVVAITVLLVGGAIPFLGSETEWAMERCSAVAPEGSQSAVSGWSWWPYGTKCRLTTSDGTTLRTVLPPWRAEVDWENLNRHWRRSA